MSRILVVEDDEDLKNITAVFLKKNGYLYDLASNSQEALALAAENEYDLVLLDVMLPGEDGNSICAKLRKNKSTPIIFVSCLDDDATIIKSLKNGGDDYVVKPYNPQQLLARIEANIRRYTEYRQKEKLASYQHDPARLSSFALEHHSHSVIRDGVVTALSPIEYCILLLFIDNPHRLLLYHEIYDHIWHRDSLGDFRTVMVHVSNLRKKLGDTQGLIIKTLRGAGYIFSG
jgi:DNA-binding response OmpR family regulator